jgi:pimeloyl-ACP methyl ester carboxylesterase
MESKKHHWLFIRGLARHSGYWSYFLPFFKARFPHDVVELLDIPGNGSEASRKSCLNVSEIVEDLRKRSQLLKQGQTLNLFTISLGSMIGLEWAYRYPKELNQLICINTSDKSTSRFYQRMQVGMMKNLFYVLKNPLSQGFLEEETIQAISKSPEESERLRRDFRKYPPPTVLNFLRQLYCAGTFEIREAPPDIRLTLIRSLGDQLCHPSCTDRIAKKWKISYHTHPVGGHDLPLYAPDWLCDVLSGDISADLPP